MAPACGQTLTAELYSYQLPHFVMAGLSTLIQCILSYPNFDYLIPPFQINSIS